MASDLDHDARSLLAAGAFFASRDAYGLAWIDRSLIVQRVYGSKAAFIAVGEPLTNSVTPFIGSEDYITHLQSDPSQSLELPGVVIVSGADEQQRYNLSLYWDAAQQSYLLLVARTSLDATLEIELLRHVRARLMAEAQIRAKSDELARANRDLEDFAAIVSHDLKAPMRALRYMTEDAGRALDDGRLDEARGQVGWIVKQSERMSSMLTVLLDYSSIGRKWKAVEQVDTRAVAEAVAGSLQGRDAFVISVAGEWPTLMTLRAPLDLVLRNLTDNAIKHHDQPRGSIVLTCTPGPQSFVIEVSDDGPGIAAEHAAAIFLPFRTLRTGEGETAGIGMGLALVERTVESVGGTIRLVPQAPGQRGATFEIVWPRHMAV